MGRPRKNPVVLNEEDFLITEVAPEEVKGVVAEEKPKPVSFTLTASFTVRDEEGSKVKLVYRGSGTSLRDALDAVKDDEGNPFPPNMNVLVNLKVQKGDATYDRALAPHKARIILQHKNEEAFNALFRGI